MDFDRLTPAERREALQAYLDGELAPDDARRAAAWIAVHPEVRGSVEGLRRLNDLLGAYADEPVPEGFTARVMAAVGETETLPFSAGRWVRVPRWVPLAAAAVLLVSVGLAAFLVLRPSTVSTPPAQESALALENVPPDLLEHADVLLSLSDAEFDAVLEMDPDEVADGPNGG